MSEHYPRIRIRAQNGSMMIREGLSFTFFMRRFHQELLPALLRSLEEYRRAVGPAGLGTYWDDEGDPQKLDAAGWELNMRDLNTGRVLIIHLGDGDGREERYDFRYPGLDIPNVGFLSWTLGTRVRGVSWMTFLGQPLLGELGGATGLRSRLHTPGTTIEELDTERAVITLGEWPEAGDTEQGHHLPAYRELARVLEPWLHHAPHPRRYLTPEDMHRWERRFLD